MQIFWGLLNPMTAALLMGLLMLCNHLGTLLVSAFAGDSSPYSHFFTIKALDMQ